MTLASSVHHAAISYPLYTPSYLNPNARYGHENCQPQKSSPSTLTIGD